MKKKNYIYFGESVEGYDVPVLNEREARAGAGLLLLPAIFSFSNAYITHHFLFTKIFVTFFMIDFFIRVLVNPKYAPTLILGRILVQNQKPEYVGAIQKRFAWNIGLLLSIVMFVIIVILEIMTPIKIVICLLCIGLLYSETAFGICLGCIVYFKITKNTPKYCPGNVCDIQTKEEIQKVSKVQWGIVSIFFIMGVSLLFLHSSKSTTMMTNTMKCESGKCHSSIIKMKK